MARSNDDILVPAASDALQQLKLEVAGELGIGAANEAQLQQQLDNAKFRVASNEGIPLTAGYNGDLPSRQAGAVGGRLGGRLGGQMVRQMIALAESQLSDRPKLAITCLT